MAVYVKIKDSYKCFSSPWLRNQQVWLKKRRIGKKSQHKNQETLIQALPLKFYVTCDRSLNISGPQYLVPQNQQGRIDNVEGCTWFWHSELFANEKWIWLSVIYTMTYQIVDIPQLISPSFAEYSRQCSWFIFPIVSPK